MEGIYLSIWQFTCGTNLFHICTQSEWLPLANDVAMFSDSIHLDATYSSYLSNPPRSCYMPYILMHMFFLSFHPCGYT